MKLSVSRKINIFSWRNKVKIIFSKTKCLEICKQTLEIWQFFLAIQCHLCEWCLFLTILQFIAYFCISVYIMVWGKQSTMHINLLRRVWRCSRIMSLILNRASFFARNFCFVDLRPLRKTFADLKKVTRSAKFCWPLAG